MPNPPTSETVRLGRWLYFDTRLRDVSKHAPNMHDGSIKTLRETVGHYTKGGTPNPHLSTKIKKLKLTDSEVDLLVSFMKSLDGEGYMDTVPEAFPQ